MFDAGQLVFVQRPDAVTQFLQSLHRLRCVEAIVFQFLKNLRDLRCDAIVRMSESLLHLPLIQFRSLQDVHILA